MARVAIFVDAGYLFAQGSTALAGQKQPRSSLELNVAAVVAELTSVAGDKSADAQLLRIYWYDGVSSFKGPTAEHTRLAQTDNVKIRLGFLNSQGQQKGVDSLIVTDLVELGRNGAICDAVLLSGDEDVRVGVQIAQSFGVRVHLIGIAPSRGSQSLQLIHEADTTTEWGVDVVQKFLSIRAAASAPAKAAVSGTSIAAPAAPIAKPSAVISASGHANASTAASGKAGVDEKIAEIANEFVGSLSGSELSNIVAFSKTARGVPSEFDGKLLARARVKLERDLLQPEKRAIRKEFMACVYERIPK